MTGGGYVVAYDAGLYERASAALMQLGGIRSTSGVSGAVAQVADDEGRLFTLYEKVPVGTEWDVYEGPFETADGVRLPDVPALVACPFVCRWADLLARLAAVIARTSEEPTWILDGDGVFWDANAVDPLAVRM